MTTEKRKDAMRAYWAGLDKSRQNMGNYTEQVNKTADDALKREEAYAAKKKAFMEGAEDDE